MDTEFNLLPQKIQDRIHIILGDVMLRERLHQQVEDIWINGCQAAVDINVENETAKFKVKACICSKSMHGEVCIRIYDDDVMYYLHGAGSLMIRGHMQD